MTDKFVGRVFLIAQPTVKRDGAFPDLSPLAEHGDIVTVVEATSRATWAPEDTLDMIVKKMLSFDHEIDMVAWAGGDTLTAVMMGNVMAMLGVPYFYWLRYDRKRDRETGERLNEGYYTPIKINIDPAYDAISGPE